MKNISIIVAIAENNAIGKNNQLLWNISDDLKRFKKLTTGQTVIMGKKTWESLPVKPLPNRRNIIISDVPGDTFKDSLTVTSIEEAIANCSDSDENFIIGGGSVYRQFIPHAQKLYLTLVHKSFDADTFFPEIDFAEWEEEEKSSTLINTDGLEYHFIIYKRRHK